MRRLLLTAAAAVLLAAFTALIVWQVRWWGRSGWAGLAFQPNPAALEIPTTLPVFSSVDPGHVVAVSPGSPAWQAGIREGDRIVAVQGVPLDDVVGLRRAAAAARSGDTVSYDVETDGVIAEREALLTSPFLYPAIVAASASTVLVALAFVFIALLVAWQRPRSEAALVFFVLSAATAAFFLLYAVVELRFPDLRGFLPIGTDFVFAALLLASLPVSMLIVALFLHLSLVFPRPRPFLQRWPEARIWLHAGPFLPTVAAGAAIGGAALFRPPLALPIVAGLAATLLALVWQLTHRARTLGPRRTLAASPSSLIVLALVTAAICGAFLRTLPDGWEYVFGIALALLTFGIFAVVIVVYSVLTSVALVRGYRESIGEERLQLRWPLWGSLVAVAGPLALTLVALLLTSLPVPPPGGSFTVSQIAGSLSKLLCLLIPVSFAVAISRYRLFALDMAIRKTIVYAAVTGAVLVTYASLAALLGASLVRSGRITGQTAAALATLAALAVGLLFRARIRKLVDARFVARERRRGTTPRRIDEAASRESDTVPSPTASDAAAGAATLHRGDREGPGARR